MSSPSQRMWLVAPLGGGLSSRVRPQVRKGVRMRSRWLLAVLALVGGLLSTTPASANVGSYCGGWRATVTGGHQMACYVRSANYEIAARGRAYYDGGERLDQLNISVTLQRSSNGTSWTNVVSRVCGFTDVPSEMPGA